MIETDKRKNDPVLAAAVRTSIGDFFTENGGELTDPTKPVPAGKVVLSFDRAELTAPVAGVFDSLAEPAKVGTFLLMFEPGVFDLRLRTPDMDAAPLEFLETSKEAGAAQEVTPEELLKLEGSERPVQALRDFLKGIAAEVRQEGVPFGRDFHRHARTGAASLIHYSVARYYAQIDRGSPADIAEICDMFAIDGVYDRAGKLLTGRPAIEAFYTSERTLQGAHTVEQIAVSGLSVLVNGVFRGVSLRENSPRVLEFADRWRFNTDGYVVNRHTYLSQGSATAQ